MSSTFLYFDAAFTLFRPMPSVGHHYAAVARGFGVDADAAKLEAAFVPAWRHARKVAAVTRELPYGRNRAEAVGFWTVVVEAVFREAGFAAPALESGYYEAVYDHFEDASCWQLYPDVEPALALLEAARVPFGILSNFDPRLHKLVAGLGIGGRMSHVVCSSEAGAEKPDRRIFDHARGLLTPAEAAEPALVGDEPEADGVGPLAAGWRQCLVARHGVRGLPEGVVARPGLVEAVELLLGI